MFKARRLEALCRIPLEENMNSPNEFEVREAWQKFLQMPEASGWYHTRRNAGLVQAEVLAGDLPYTANALLFAFRKLKDALDVKQQPVSTPPPAVVPETVVDESTLPGYPIRGGLEDGWSYQNRVTAWREARAQRAWRDSENARMLAQPPAESTLRRTRAERNLVAAQQQRFRDRQSSDTKFGNES
jgi:hypothetical protein